MGTFGYSTASIEGDVYIQRLSSYIKKNEEAIANGLLCFSKTTKHHHYHQGNSNSNRTTSNNNNNNSLANVAQYQYQHQQHTLTIKPLRLTFTIHHLYYLLDRIEQLDFDVEVGPLNIKLEVNPNQEPTFISFMANNARGDHYHGNYNGSGSGSGKQFDSDTRSITSINSMRSIVSSASAYWRSFSISNDPKIIKKDLRYLYSSFTKIPCLILTPKTKVNSILGYEEYPCDTSVPIQIFKNLQVLELIEYEPNEIFGWHILSDQLRILILRKSKINDLEELLVQLVDEDENGRSRFNGKHIKHQHQYQQHHKETSFAMDDSNDVFRQKRRAGRRYTTSSATANAIATPTAAAAITVNSGDAPTAGAISTSATSKGANRSSPHKKWAVLKQLTVSETSIAHIPRHLFTPLLNLVKLNLSNNLLHELPQGLEQLTSVKYLNFADNYITNLKNLPSNLSNLVTLNLNNNKLTDLNGLENLASLDKIDLRRNQLPDLASLKPIVTLYKKIPEKFTNVYLSNNKLPKTFRTDLFNLFNGVKYKNTIKIDDSRPGYFEKASLLDQEAAKKNLDVFYRGHKREDSELTLANTSEESQNKSMKIQPNQQAKAQGSVFVQAAASSSSHASTPSQAPTPTPTPTLVSNSPDLEEDEIITKFRDLQVEHQSQKSSLNLHLAPASPSFKKHRKYELSHTVSSTPAPLALLSQPGSPSCLNFNIGNLAKHDGGGSPSTLKPIMHINSSSSSLNQSSSSLGGASAGIGASGMKRSSTLVDFENHTAPSIVTAVQVTARMST